MRCSASPTTSIAAERVQPDERASAQNVVNAILFREILKPLAHGLGPVGETALSSVADALFVKPAR